MTKAELLAVMKRDAGKAMSAEQIRRQKFSYVLSTFDNPTEETEKFVAKRFAAMSGDYPCPTRH